VRADPQATAFGSPNSASTNQVRAARRVPEKVGTYRFVLTGNQAGEVSISCRAIADPRVRGESFLDRRLGRGYKSVKEPGRDQASSSRSAKVPVSGSIAEPDDDTAARTTRIASPPG
jgi:hypothetical protein